MSTTITFDPNDPREKSAMNEIEAPSANVASDEAVSEAETDEDTDYADAMTDDDDAGDEE